MENAKNNLVTIGQLSRKLKISVVWIKTQASKGVLPYINAGGKLLFNFDVVKRSLNGLAGKKGVVR